MRTTISLDDRVATAAKRTAARQGVSFSALVGVALRNLLAERPAPNESPFELLTAGRGGPMPGLDLDRTSSLLVAEDEEIYGDAARAPVAPGPSTRRRRARRGKR